MIYAALILALIASAEAEAAAQPMPRELTTEDAQPADTQRAGIVQLRGLDTLNGTVSDFEVPLGGTTSFGHLEITAEACRVPDDAVADSFALLRIRDIREEEPRFTGWMFASSPALSALDHPRYDVWVLSCNNR